MRLGSQWEGFTVTVRTLHDAGEHVVMEGRYAGHYKPSGRSVDAQVHMLGLTSQAKSGEEAAEQPDAAYDARASSADRRRPRS
jgi:hypothetical protein